MDAESIADPVQSLGRAVATFDLSGSAAEYDRSGIRPRRILLYGVVGLGCFMFAIAFTDVGALLTSVTALLFLIGGIVLVAGSLTGIRFVPMAATRIEVTSDQLRFSRLDGRTFARNWSDPHVQVEIRDWRSITPTQRSHGLEWVQFVVSPNLPVEAAVDSEIVAKLVSEAERHGMVVTGWNKAPPAHGRMRLIRFAHQ